MLLADIRRHALAAAQNDEDYLTSAVFGHLRYIPPEYFWERLLSLARGLADGQAQKSLHDFIRRTEHGVSEYSSLKVLFWPEHRRGEPDLLLSFTGIGLRPIAVIIEVKLWSGKSAGDEDQLVRYLRILDELQEFWECKLPDGSLGALLYLTPRESIAEIRDSLKLSPNPKRDQTRIFRLQWQDFIQVCDETVPTREPQIDMILRDVREFLKLRGLEYFAGFRRLAALPDLRVKRACFNRLFVRLDALPDLRVETACFNRLFVRLDALPELQVRRAYFNRLFARLGLPERFAPRRAPWM
jgi:hypothetical protein